MIRVAFPEELNEYEGVAFMGLDGVELMMEIEDAFGISFEEQELKDVLTVGDLVTAVAGRVGEKAAPIALPKPSCDPLAAVCRSVAEATGCDEGALRSDRKLAELVPRKGWPDVRDRIVAAMSRQGYVPLYSLFPRRWTIGKLAEMTFAPDDVRGRVIAFITQKTHIAPGKIAMQSRLVQDLGLG